MYLFVDTETTGLPTDYNSLNSYRNVRLVQIAWIIYDSSGKKIDHRDFFVKPEGFEIPETATRIHKISNSFALSCGKSINKVLKEFNNAVKTCKYLVAHNLNYDYNVLLSEFDRLYMDTTLNELEQICTMKATTDFCAITTSRGKKWPTLSELHRKVFDTDFNEAHNAVVDIEATAKCFWVLKKKNLVKFENISNDIKKEISSIQNEFSIISRKSNNIEPQKIIYNVSRVDNQNNNNMNLKEYAIRLKSYCDSLRDGDSISKRQASRLFEMLDEFIVLIENEDENDDDWSDTDSEDDNFSIHSGGDDLPF